MNILLRGFSLLSRLVFLIYFQSQASVSDFAIFGLVVGFVGFFLIILGLELHNKINFSLSSSDEGVIPHVISIAYARYIKSCIIFGPLLSLILFSLFDTRFSLIIIYILLCSEYISTELSRTLIFINKQLLSSILLVIRSALWVVLAYILQKFLLIDFSVNTVINVWAFFSAASCAFGFFFIRKYLNKSLIYAEMVCGNYFRLVYKTFPMLLVALSYQYFFVVDRWLIKQFEDINFLSGYVFHAMLCTSVLAIIDAGVINFVNPKIFRAISQNEIHKLRKHALNAFRKIIFIHILFLPIYFGVSHYCYKNLNPLPVIDIIAIYIGNFAFSISSIPHLIVYGFFGEKILMRLQIIVAMFFSLSGLFLMAVGSVRSIIYLFAISFFILLIIKAICAKNLINGKSAYLFFSK